MRNRIIALVLTLSFVIGIAGCSPLVVGYNQETSSYTEYETISNTESSSEEETSSEAEKLTSTYTSVIPGTEETTSQKATASTYAVTADGYIDLTIDNTTAVQDNWLGVTAVNQGYMFHPDVNQRQYNDAQIEEELRRMDEMDVNMVRSYYEASFAYESYDPSTGEFTWNWDSELMQATFKWLDAMKERGIDVALQMGWGLSDQFRVGTTYWGYGEGNPFYQLSSIEDMAAAYGEWVVASVQEIVINRGYDNVKWIVMFTEPNNGENTFYSETTGGNIVEEGWDTYIRFVDSAGNALEAAGIRDKIDITGPQVAFNIAEKKYDDYLENLNWWVEQDKTYGLFDVYSFHWYVPHWPGMNTSSTATIYDDNYDTWFYYFNNIVTALKDTGKEFWFDEWNYGGGFLSDQLKTAYWYPHAALQAAVAAMNAGVQNTIYWQLFEIVWPQRTSSDGGEFIEGIHSMGIAPTLYNSSVPFPLYYAFTLFSKYSGEQGSTVYKGTGDESVYLTMAEYEKDGETVKSVIVMNLSAIERNITINFEQSIGANMYRHLYSPSDVECTSAAEIPGIDKAFENVGTELMDTIPGGGIVVYTTTTK